MGWVEGYCRRGSQSAIGGAKELEAGQEDPFLSIKLWRFL